MSALLLLLIALILFVLAYLIYARYLERVWGIDEKRQTPAHALKDDVDYVPASKIVLFGHQFASIAGSGPINGPIIAAMFGWLPVALWIILGGIFMGAVQDFSALYASVRNEGKSVGALIERYVGKTGKVSFLLFVWLLCILVIAAFADIVAGTFNGFAAEGLNRPGGLAASSSVFFIGFALLLGFILRRFALSSWAQCLVALVLLLLGLACGMNLPLFLSQGTWLVVIFAYIFIASIMPMWMLLQPRDFMNSFLLIAMIGAAIVGVIVAQPCLHLPAFVGFKVDGLSLFPMLFVTVSCGAISGFHTMISSGTTSKQVNNEKDMKLIGYGGMLLESVLALIALIAVGALYTSTGMPQGAPPVIFAHAISGFLVKLGLPVELTYSLIILAISSFGLTTLDSVARIARMCFQELFTGEGTLSRLLNKSIVATMITIAVGASLAVAGYKSIWPLMGAANQLIGALSLFAIALFLKKTGKKSAMLALPMYAMLIIAFSSLAILIYDVVLRLIAGGANMMGDILLLFFALLLTLIGASITKGCLFVKR